MVGSPDQMSLETIPACLRPSGFVFRAWGRQPEQTGKATGLKIPPCLWETPFVEPGGTCTRCLAAVLGFRKASLLQTALKETIVVQSPGPSLSLFWGALAVQANILAPGPREAACGWQGSASFPWSFLSIQVLGAQGTVPLRTQWILAELSRGRNGTSWAGLAREHLKSLNGINPLPSLPTWLPFKGPEEGGVRWREGF